jgi:hypothetical protein
MYMPPLRSRRRLLADATLIFGFKFPTATKVNAYHFDREVWAEVKNVFPIPGFACIIVIFPNGI